MDKCVLVDSPDAAFPSRKVSAGPPAPTFWELGKACRNVFSGGYNPGFANVNFKTKIEDTVEVKAGGSLNNETGDFAANLSSSYTMKNYGLNFTEKWSTNNTIGTAITLVDNLAEGLMLGVETSFTAATGEKMCKVKSQYRTPKLALAADLNLVPNGLIVNASAAYVIEKFILGYQVVCDTSNTENVQLGHNFAFGYSMDDFVLSARVNNLKEYSGSIYRKPNSQLETGIHFAWQSDDTNISKFGIGCKYDLDENITLRAKVDENCCVGLSFQTKIRDGVACTLSTEINGKSINEGGHKLGVSLDFEA